LDFSRCAGVSISPSPSGEKRRLRVSLSCTTPGGLLSVLVLLLLAVSRGLLFTFTDQKTFLFMAVYRAGVCGCRLFPPAVNRQGGCLSCHPRSVGRSPSPNTAEREPARNKKAPGHAAMPPALPEQNCMRAVEAAGGATTRARRRGPAEADTQGFYLFVLFFKLFFKDCYCFVLCLNLCIRRLISTFYVLRAMQLYVSGIRSLMPKSRLTRLRLLARNVHLSVVPLRPSWHGPLLPNAGAARAIRFPSGSARRPAACSTNYLPVMIYPSLMDEPFELEPRRSLQRVGAPTDDHLAVCVFDQRPREDVRRPRRDATHVLPQAELHVALHRQHVI